MSRKNAIKFTYESKDSHTHYGVDFIQMRHGRLRTADKNTFLRPMKIEVWIVAEQKEEFESYLGEKFFNSYMHPSSSEKVIIHFI